MFNVILVNTSLIFKRSCLSNIPKLKNAGIPLFFGTVLFIFFFNGSSLFCDTGKQEIQKEIGPASPVGLMTDLLERTDTVWLDGFPSSLSLNDLATATERYQIAEIRSGNPSFGWIVCDSRRNIIQTAYQIQLSPETNFFSVLKKQVSQGKNETSKEAFWDTGKRISSNSTNVIYDGKTLLPDTVYYWRVRTWNNGQKSPWSKIKGFKTAKKLTKYDVSRYPIVKETDLPVSSKKLPDGTMFYDFGEASFGQLRLVLTAEKEGQTAIVRLGERVKDGRVDRKPFGTTRYWSYLLNLLPGRQTYVIKTRVDKRNTTGEAFLIPGYIGEVMPFRYAEVETHSPQNVKIIQAFRHSAYYPFNDNAGYFHCDNESLNKVWHLCKRSIKAASFLGVYIDGDRERIPYGGDSLFQQLIHYGIDREYSLARFTQEYIIFHPTWPSECPMRAVQMAWYDYLYTGDLRNIRKFYDELKTQSLLVLAEDNGLISTRKGKVTRKFLDSIHFKGEMIRDLVDWPWPGFSKGVKGETDGFVFCDFNPVVNAYHYFAVVSLENFARALGRSEDAKFFKKRAELIFDSYQKVFYDEKQGAYRDGETTDHASLHSNIFAMSLGLVPPKHRTSVLRFIKSRGMACSIFGAKFMLDSVYDLEDGDYGLALMTENGLRGWLNMIRIGTTIIPEAWDDSLKPNLDWNHASGGTPGNIIPHKLVGVEPLTPAAALLRIKPQLGSLKQVNATVPTVRGPVILSLSQTPNKLFVLNVDIPANTTAEIWLPKIGKEVLLDGLPLKSVLAKNPDDDTFKMNSKNLQNKNVSKDSYQVKEDYRNLTPPEDAGKFWMFRQVGSGQWIFESR